MVSTSTTTTTVAFALNPKPVLALAVIAVAVFPLHTAVAVFLALKKIDSILGCRRSISYRSPLHAHGPRSGCSRSHTWITKMINLLFW